MGLKLDIVASDGSQLNVTPKTIYGDGVQIGTGGAEMSILTLAELWTKAGHDVTFYNNPREQTETLKQASIATFNPREDRDILIIYRSPNSMALQGAKGKKVWFSTDQYAGGGIPFNVFAPMVDQIVCISPHHINYFEQKYRINNAIYIDLPVRTWDYDTHEPVEKIPGRLLFSSVPHRGLMTLAECYPEIKKRIPHASLVVTSDYRLWGAGSPNNQQHRMKLLELAQMDVQFMGAIPRMELIKHQLAAEILSFPCVYEELFCIAVSEAQYAGCYPITSMMGALKTTNMGIQIPGDPQPSLYQNEMGFNLSWKKFFIEAVEKFLLEPEALAHEQEVVRKAAKERFSPEVVLAQWDERVFNG